MHFITLINGKNNLKDTQINVTDCITSNRILSQFYFAILKPNRHTRFSRFNAIASGIYEGLRMAKY